MTQSINKPFKAQLAEYEAKKAIDKALKPAPAVAKVQQGLVPAPKTSPATKATKTSPAKKSGRVVGISADENKFLKTLLETIAQDANYDTMIVSDAYTKLIGRYNK